MPSDEFGNILDEIYSLFVEKNITEASTLLKKISNNMVSIVPNANALLSQRCKCLKSKKPDVSNAKSDKKYRPLVSKTTIPSKVQDTSSSDSSSDNGFEQRISMSVKKPSGAEKNLDMHKSIASTTKTAVLPSNVCSDSSVDSSSDEEINFIPSTKNTTDSTQPKEENFASKATSAAKKKSQNQKMLKNDEKTFNEKLSSFEPISNAKAQFSAQTLSPNFQKYSSTINKGPQKPPATSVQSSSESLDSSSAEEALISKIPVKQKNHQINQPHKTTLPIIIKHNLIDTKIKLTATSSESETSSDTSDEDSKPAKTLAVPSELKPLVASNMRDSLNTKTQGIKKTEIKSGESDKNKSTATTQHHSTTDDSSTEESSSEDIAPIVVKKLSSKLTAFKPEKYNSSSSSSSEEPTDKNKFPSTIAVKKELSDSSSDSDSSASSNCQIPDLVQNHKKTEAANPNKPKITPVEVITEQSKTDVGKAKGVRISKKASKSSQKVVNESKQKAFNTKVAKSKTITAKSAVSLRENLRSKTEERSELALNQDQIKAASSIIENSTASPLGDNNIVSTRLKSFHESTQKTTDGNILTSAPKNISQKSKKKVCDKIESAIGDVSPICKKSVKKTKSVQNQSSLPVKENLIETKSSVQPLNITQEETLLSKNMKRKKSVKSDHASEKKSNAESKVFEDSPLIMNKSSSTTFKRVSLPMGEIPEELRDNNFKPKNRNESGVHAQLAFQRVQGKDFKREKNKRKKGSFALGAINTTSRSFKFSEEEN